MALNGVKVMPKGERPNGMDWDVYEYSSDVTVFNLYEQEWAGLVAEGLTHLFKDKEEFESKKLERQVEA